MFFVIVVKCQNPLLFVDPVFVDGNSKSSQNLSIYKN